MDTARHFSSYRESLKKDALGGFDAYASIITTAQPDSYPHAIDYLKHTFAHAASTAASQNAASYKIWVERHRFAMMALFDRMVEDVLWDYRSVKATSLTRLVEENGWSWFKFCRLPLSVKMQIEGGPVDIVFVPRYDEAFRSFWSRPGQATLDADEGRIIFSEKPDVTVPIIRRKLEAPGHKMVGEERLFRPVEGLNGPSAVVDWSLPLF